MPNTESNIIVRDKQVLLKNIDSIARRGKILDKDIHSAAVSCIHHAGATGDVTLATRLIAAMPKSGRRNALIFWFESFGMMNWSKDAKASKGKDSSRFVHDRKKESNVTGAVDTPFWEFKKEQDYSFDIDKFIGMIVGKVKTAKDHEMFGTSDFTKLKEAVAKITVPEVVVEASEDLPSSLQEQAI